MVQHYGNNKSVTNCMQPKPTMVQGFGTVRGVILHPRMFSPFSPYTKGGQAIRQAYNSTARALTSFTKKFTNLSHPVAKQYAAYVATPAYKKAYSDPYAYLPYWGKRLYRHYNWVPYKRYKRRPFKPRSSYSPDPYRFRRYNRYRSFNSSYRRRYKPYRRKRYRRYTRRFRLY